MKKILFLFLAINMFSFSEMEDQIKIISMGELRQIEKKIDEVERKNEVKIFVKTVNGEESMQVENPQKTVMIIIQKISETKYATELKFTEDLRMEERDKEIDLLLNYTKEKIFKKDFKGYIISILDGVSSILESRREINEEESEIADEGLDLNVEEESKK